MLLSLCVGGQFYKFWLPMHVRPSSLCTNLWLFGGRLGGIASACFMWITHRFLQRTDSSFQLLSATAMLAWANNRISTKTQEPCNFHTNSKANSWICRVSKKLWNFTCCLSLSSRTTSFSYKALWGTRWLNDDIESLGVHDGARIYNDRVYIWFCWVLVLNRWIS